MSKAQLVTTAVVLESRCKAQVARDYDLSRQWVDQLITRYQADGAAAFEPRPRHHQSPSGIDDLADPKPPRIRHPTTAQTPTLSLETFLRRTTQRTLASRRHHWRLADNTEVEILNVLGGFENVQAKIEDFIREKPLDEKDSDVR